MYIYSIINLYVVQLEAAVYLQTFIIRALYFNWSMQLDRISYCSYMEHSIQGGKKTQPHTSTIQRPTLLICMDRNFC